MDFKPSREIDIAGAEMAVATYIFSKDLLDSQILIDSGLCRGDRGTLRTLEPRTEIVDDVINLLVSMLKKTAPPCKWYMPMTIMQAVIEGRRLSSPIVARIARDYMPSKVDEVRWIYQPMWCLGHWFLMIIDVPRKRLIHLDSLHNRDMEPKRREAMEKVAPELEMMTVGDGWLKNPAVRRPRFSTFEFDVPTVPQQDRNS
ncbi:hypothetical protein PIB30_048240 [Stylosanthes scabra]|uniref:Ubiquitin-like protease family profile domain-containing protein n=1 Tax=Stylosanthes scabra TaxID=79078 RepID=A0ABU6WF40_9FABA|nr:hypothetical protein [Stylosanthes scabra]